MKRFVLLACVILAGCRDDQSVELVQRPAFKPEPYIVCFPEGTFAVRGEDGYVWSGSDQIGFETEQQAWDWFLKCTSHFTDVVPERRTDWKACK